MKFLVILVCIIVNYWWLKDFDRFDDAWFFKFRVRLLKRVGSLQLARSAQPVLSVFLLYLIPMMVLAVALYLLSDLVAGLLTMLVHILVLLVAFDRTQPGRIAKDFLLRWREGDTWGTYQYLQQSLSMPSTAPDNSNRELYDYFCKQFTYRCFEKMFVMFFAYLTLGPLSVLFCYISYQIRDCQQHEELLEQLEHGLRAEEKEKQLLHRLLFVIEWLPLRLLGLTFSLVGNFVQCFDCLKSTLWETKKSSADILYSYISCALSGTISISSDGDSIDDTDSTDSTDDTDDTDDDAFRKRAATQIEALQALLERSQLIWLCVIAAVAVFGVPTIG